MRLSLHSPSGVHGQPSAPAGQPGSTQTSERHSSGRLQPPPSVQAQPSVPTAHPVSPALPVSGSGAVELRLPGPGSVAVGVAAVGLVAVVGGEEVGFVLAEDAVLVLPTGS